MASDDTYNDDLEWILEKLADRAGAESGVILRFGAGGTETLVLARAPSQAETDPALVEALHCAATGLGAANVNGPLLSVVHQFAWRGASLMFLRFRVDPDTTIVAAVGRTGSSFGLIHRAVAEKLHPVLDRYLRLWWLHRCERRRVSAMQSSMDLCDLGVMLLDRRGRLTFVNRFARELVDRRDTLRLVNGTLAANSAEDNVRLQAALQHALLGNLMAGAPMPPAAATVRRSLMLSLRRTGGRSLIVTVVSFESPAIDQDDTAAILYVLDPDVDVRDMLAPAFRLYRLAPSEARLVSCLVGGSTLAEASMEMGVSHETARGYLKQVFHKTSTNRQADLLKVMLGSASRTRVSPDLSLM